MIKQRSKLISAFFFVSLYSIAFETFLSRYFAVTNWAEYGYWVISIVMAGFAISGLVLSLFEKFFEKRSRILIALIPPLIVIFSAIGVYLVSINQFNPLEFQHEVMWKSQLGNIFLYYAALFPVFFLLGCYIGLVYVIHYRDISRIYAVNLIASAFGSVAILAVMYGINVFRLMGVVLPLMVIPLLFSLEGVSIPIRRAIFFTGLVLLVPCEIFFFTTDKMAFPFYKPITGPLNVENNVVVDSKSLPNGYFIVLDNMTEFDNIDLSNNYDLLKMGPPPRSYGIYRDGRRISSLMNSLPEDYSYLNGALDSFPYHIRPNAKTLLAGTNGGFRIAERQHMGVSSITALESESTLFSLIKKTALDKNGIVSNGTSFDFIKDNPYGFLSVGKKSFDIIDYSPEFLGTSDNNRYSYTVESIKLCVEKLNDGGIVSIPVSISEFTVHAIKMIETVKQALISAGVSDPSANVLVYRSNWTARILVSNKSFSQKDISALKKFCGDRSFDASFYKGIDPAKADIFNDLPAVSFDELTVSSQNEFASDAIMTDAIKVFGPSGESFIQNNFFNLNPATIDRPSFFSVLRLKNIAQVMKKRSILPQEEVGFLVNIFILVQALLLALVILVLPLIRIRSLGKEKKKIPSIMIYFACLGLGFLFIEMALIERFTLFLGNATASFSIVLAGMLIFSGTGSYFSSRYSEKPLKGVMIAVGLITVSVVFYILFLFPIIQSLADSYFAVKVILVLLIISPVSFALGMPFPMGLSSLRNHTGSLLPWAWAINGAFSVISTPLASIISVANGYTMLFAISIGLYLLAFAFFPGRVNKAEL